MYHIIIITHHDKWQDIVALRSTHGNINNLRDEFITTLLDYYGESGDIIFAESISE